MNQVKSLIPLREYCRNNHWPRLSQWHHWINSEHLIAEACIKKIGGRYLIDLEAFGGYIQNATLNEKKIK